MLSLLYSSPQDIPHADNKLVDDLLLDTAFTGICPNVSERQIFLAVLTNPLTFQSEIDLRASVIGDFVAAPNLCDGLDTELNKLIKLKNDAQRERSRAFTTSRSVNSDAAFASAVFAAGLYAQTVEQAMYLISQISLVLGMYSVRSAALSAVKHRADIYLDDESEVVEICRKMKDFSTDSGAASLRIELTDSGRINSCELISIENNIENDTKKPIFKKLFTKIAEPKKSSDSVLMQDPFDTIKNQLFSSAFAQISDLLDHLSRQIFDEFCPLARELSFYKTALKYIDMLKKKRIPLCFPTTADTMEIHELYDILLSAEMPTADGIVPHDISMRSKSNSPMPIIVTGENNSGKTVFLRSIGCAQLFYQAGLPIPAKRASMRLHSAVYNRYAASEKEFCTGNDAGRFEQEVRELVPLIEAIKPGSLLLLNEIFQTTAYSEGAEGLYHNLKYLEESGTSFIIVTHLRELLDRFKGSAVHMQTCDRYRLCICSPTE